MKKNKYWTLVLNGWYLINTLTILQRKESGHELTMQNRNPFIKELERLTKKSDVLKIKKRPHFKDYRVVKVTLQIELMKKSR